MKAVTTHEAKTQLSRLLAEVEAGDEVTICRGDVPVARLVGIDKKARASRPMVGTKTSAAVVVEKDAFAPLSDDELLLWGIE
jgi:prevent-host-death family protein